MNIEFLPEADEECLERLLRGTERAFPNAGAFVRPGFD